MSSKSAVRLVASENDQLRHERPRTPGGARAYLDAENSDGLNELTPLPAA
jgi:hypothetical protein